MHSPDLRVGAPERRRLVAKSPPERSFRAKFVRPTRAVALLGALAVLVVWLASEAFLYGKRIGDLDHALDEAKSTSRIIAEQKVRALQGVDLLLAGVVERVDELRLLQVAGGDLRIHLSLRSRIVAMPHIASLFLVGADGRVTSASGEHPVSPVDVTDREYYLHHRDARSAGPFIGPPLINRMGGAWTVHMSRGIRTRDGRFAGVAVAALNLEYFEDFNDLKIEYITPVSLYLHDGRLLTRTPRDESLLGRRLELPPVRGGWEGAMRITRVVGENAGMVVYRDLDGYPLTLAVATAERAALARWRESAFMVRIGAAVGSLFIVLSTLLLMREVRREQRLSTRLAETGRTLQALVDGALDAIVAVDEDRRIVFFNPAAEAMFGRSAAEALGSPLKRFLQDAWPDETGLGVLDRQAMGIRSDGSGFPVELSVSQLTHDGRSLSTVVVRDISERVRAQTMLNETNAELSRLSKSLIAVRESERTRIARELHDELGQQLMRLGLDLSWLGGRLRGSQAELDEKIAQMKGLLSETVASVRRITTELRPPLLDDLGPAAAVDWLLDDFARRSGLQVKATIDPAIDRCDAETATAIYRILQEALTNVVRHADAGEVCVRMGDAGDHLFLEIEDDGKGVGSDDSTDLHGGNGLVGIRERVLMLGGRLEIGNGRTGGLALTIDLPLPALASGGEQAQPGSGMAESVA